jgi:hypothetical protein
MGASTSHNLMGLHSLLQGQLYLLLFSDTVRSDYKQNKLRASELYRLSVRHLLTKFNANFCG